MNLKNLIRKYPERAEDITLLAMLTFSKTRYEVEFMELNKDFIKKVGKIINGFPVQYAAGRVLFRDIELNIEPGVFIPRPETESLIDIVKERVKYPEKVLDLCTGSGAIAISLKKEFPHARVIGTDISERAISLSKRNSILNRIDVEFLISDLFERVKERSFDLITANPPYVDEDEMDSLPDEVKFEPVIALNGGKDGFEIIKRIISQSHSYLRRGGFLFMEIDPGHKGHIEKMNLKGFEIRFYRDMHRRVRFVELRKV